MSASNLEIVIEQATPRQQSEQDDRSERSFSPRRNKTFESTVFLGPDLGSITARRNKTFESTLFKDSTEIPEASPNKPAKKSYINSPKPSISECFSATKEAKTDSKSGIAYENLSRSTSKLNKTFQSSLFSDTSDVVLGSPRSAKKLVTSAPKTNIGPVFDRTINQENNMNQNNLRPSKKPASDTKTSMKQVFDKNEPVKARPAKKGTDSDKTSMNLVLGQVKLDNKTKVRMSPGGPTAIVLA